MKNKNKYQTFWCRFCGTSEDIKDDEDNIKLEEVTAVYCSVCACKGYKRKMLKVKENEKKN